jgi:pilus assembly protein CpaC
VGGEIPIVYATSNVATINYKEFGVLLTFTPEFTDDGKIDLRVEMEVSEPSTAFSTSFAGFEVPAFISRQAETRALLEEGQTLLLGGLYREQTSETVNKVPYLGDIPLLGMAFRRTAFDSSRTELLMAVRPAVARETEELAVERLPTDRPPLSREEVRTRQNPYEVTRPRIGRRRPPQPPAGWPTEGESIREKSRNPVE